MDRARYLLSPELLKRLTGDVWEFRTLHYGKHYRMLAFWDKREKIDTLIIVTHGFIKKTAKVSKSEIAKTDQIMKKYFNL